MTSNQKEFYAFAIFQDALALNVLTLNIKSVNFHTNILTTFSEGLKTLQKNVIVGKISGFQLWLSISDSIVSSTSHAVNFSDISTYKNLAINMKDLVIKSGDVIFENKRERCELLEHIRYIIEIYNVTICNTGNVTLKPGSHVRKFCRKPLRPKPCSFILIFAKKLYVHVAPLMKIFVRS